ncbi:MAG TPA: hypothetical protein VG847_13920 [Chitinophagaceae bacterium]|nr:hypothetical protein [Chitinophagaceae bacterium]
MDYSNLRNLRVWSNGGAGIAPFALVAPFSYFATNGIKSPQAPFAALGDQVKITTAHQFLEGKGWLYYILAPAKNKLDIDVVGDPGFVKQSQTANLYFPGNSPELHETYQALLNVPCIVLVKDSNCAANLYMQLGCDCEGAYLGGPWNSGTSKDSAKGFSATFTYDGPAMFYAPDPTSAIMADVAS